MAAVALANGLNANMLRRWVQEAAAGGGASKIAAASATAARASFMQLPMREAAAHPVPDTRPAQLAMPVAAQQQAVDVTVEINRGGTTVHAKLPLDSHSAAWLREVLG